MPDSSNSIVSVEGPTCTISSPYGTVTWLGRDVKQPPAGPRRREIEHRRHVARRHPAERTRRATQAHFNGVRRIADQLETGRQVLELDRRAHHALDNALARDDQPQQERDQRRQKLQSEIAKWMVRHQPKE